LQMKFSQERVQHYKQFLFLRHFMEKKVLNPFFSASPFRGRYYQHFTRYFFAFILAPKNFKAKYN
jgi:hypothetical protein